MTFVALQQAWNQSKAMVHSLTTAWRQSKKKVLINDHGRQYAAPYETCVLMAVLNVGDHSPSTPHILRFLEAGFGKNCGYQIDCRTHLALAVCSSSTIAQTGGAGPLAPL